MKALILGKAERQILLGVPILFAAGTAMHFLYALSGGQFVVGLFVPVNESVWEHLKMVLWPMLVWWLVQYLRGQKWQETDAAAWFSGTLTALLAAQGTVLVLFYVLLGAFGVESVTADVGIFLLALLLGQWAGLRRWQKGSHLSWPVPLFLIALGLALSLIFTLAPPPFPLFIDQNTGLRGIFRL